jgi:Winged helix DNA-binding domain
MLNDREVVRMTLMRGTVHLVTARDALLLRPLLHPVIERGYNGAFRRRIAGVDLTELARATREIVDTTARRGEDPRAFLTARAIASRLIERGIGDDTEAIRYGLTRRSSPGPAASSRRSQISRRSYSATSARSDRRR